MDVQHLLCGFVYRIPAAWEQREPAFHLEVAEYVDIPGRGPTLLGEPKIWTPEQAATAGFTLPSVLESIGLETLQEVEQLRQERAALETTVEENRHQIDAMKATIEGLQTEMQTLKDEKRSAAMGAEAQQPAG